ncbi:MAG: hypothetical protein J3K34DRAFT_179473 [Monoraphidium minutum]|nr:MAG: hypothetical protein J3K34DRAFT_179473 [Monoraphidium minutum]
MLFCASSLACLDQPHAALAPGWPGRRCRLARAPPTRPQRPQVEHCSSKLSYSARGGQAAAPQRASARNRRRRPPNLLPRDPRGARQRSRPPLHGRSPRPGACTPRLTLSTPGPPTHPQPRHHMSLPTRPRTLGLCCHCAPPARPGLVASPPPPLCPSKAPPAAGSCCTLPFMIPPQRPRARHGLQARAPLRARRAARAPAGAPAPSPAKGLARPRVGSCCTITCFHLPI